MLRAFDRRLSRFSTAFVPEITGGVIFTPPPVRRVRPDTPVACGLSRLSDVSYVKKFDYLSPSFNESIAVLYYFHTYPWDIRIPRRGDPTRLPASLHTSLSPARPRATPSPSRAGNNAEAGVNPCFQNASFEKTWGSSTRQT